MPTMRQTNGLSGFTKRSESEYDCFGTGHSSTTISAGLGIHLTSLFVCISAVSIHQESKFLSMDECQGSIFNPS